MASKSDQIQIEVWVSQGASTILLVAPEPLDNKARTNIVEDVLEHNPSFKRVVFQERNPDGNAPFSSDLPPSRTFLGW